MLYNNVPTTFSAKESDFFPVSGGSGLNINSHPMHSLMENSIVSLSNFVHPVYKSFFKKLKKDHLQFPLFYEEVSLRISLQVAATVM